MVLWMHFNGRQAEFFLKVIEDSQTMPAVFREKRVAELIRQCFAVYNSNSSERDFLVSQIIYSVILSIVHFVCKENALLQVDSRTKFMNRAVSYIDDNIYRKITLGQLAKEFNLSPYHFCRVFEKYFHMTPMRYVLMKKIEISKYLLTYTQDTLSGIASSLNFADQSHFSKTFKQFQKESPLAFRKKLW